MNFSFIVFSFMFKLITFMIKFQDRNKGTSAYMWISVSNGYTILTFTKAHSPCSYNNSGDSKIFLYLKLMFFFTINSRKKNDKFIFSQCFGAVTSIDCQPSYMPISYSNMEYVNCICYLFCTFYAIVS